MSEATRSPDGDAEDSAPRGASVRRRYAQLLRLHEEVAEGLEAMRRQLEAPAVHHLIDELPASAGERVSGRLGQVNQSLEDSLRTVRLCESDLRRELAGGRPPGSLDGLPDLPSTLLRFMDERRETPGFSWEVLDDPVRGWMVRWKEYSSEGLVRGRGQFYERPYAWLEEQ